VLTSCRRGSAHHAQSKDSLELGSRHLTERVARNLRA
jgi:hypothetical protein